MRTSVLIALILPLAACSTTGTKATSYAKANNLMQREIDSLARDEMDRTQRESYLRHQMKAIMEELGEGNDVAEEVEQYRRRAAALRWPSEAEEEFQRQL